MTLSIRGAVADAIARAAQAWSVTRAERPSEADEMAERRAMLVLRALLRGSAPTTDSVGTEGPSLPHPLRAFLTWKGSTAALAPLELGRRDQLGVTVAHNVNIVTVVLADEAVALRRILGRALASSPELRVHAAGELLYLARGLGGADVKRALLGGASALLDAGRAEGLAGEVRRKLAALGSGEFRSRYSRCGRLHQTSSSWSERSARL